MATVAIPNLEDLLAELDLADEKERKSTEQARKCVSVDRILSNASDVAVSGQDLHKYPDCDQLDSNVGHGTFEDLVAQTPTRCSRRPRGAFSRQVGSSTTASSNISASTTSLIQEIGQTDANHQRMPRAGIASPKQLVQHQLEDSTSRGLVVGKTICANATTANFYEALDARFVAKTHRTKNFVDSHFTCPLKEADLRKASIEVKNFEERRRKALEEERARAARKLRLKLEAAAEMRERIAMSAIEADEQRERARRRASTTEQNIRARWDKELENRKYVSALEREKAHVARKKRRKQREEEKLNLRAKKRAGRFAQLVEQGYVFGPGGMTKLDSACGETVGLEPSDDEGSLESDVSSAGETECEVLEQNSSESDHAGQVREASDRDRRDPSDPAVIPFEEILESIDNSIRNDGAIGDPHSHLDVVPALETILAVVDEDSRRDQVREDFRATQEAFSALGGRRENKKNETNPLVFQVAKERRPDVDWFGTVAGDSSLKPFNDFDEVKQGSEGNSFEERCARSASIQAKLQAARNRMSLVRWQAQGSRAGENAISSGWPPLTAAVASKNEQPTATPLVPGVGKCGIPKQKPHCARGQQPNRVDSGDSRPATTKNRIIDLD